MDSSSLQPPGYFPDEWRRLAFDDFTTLKRGKDLTRDQFRNGRIPVAGSNGPIGFHDTANVKAPGATVGRSGSVGRVTFYREDFWAHNTALFVANFHGNDARFAAYFLDSVKLNRFGSGVSVPTLDRNVFRSLPVVVPPLPEQRKIAGVLGLVQRAMEQQERLIEKTAELKKTLLHQFFTQGTRGEPQKQTDLGPVPESWEVMRVGRFGKVVTGSTPSTKNPEYYNGPYRLVSPADLDTGKYVVSSHRTLTEAGFAECRGLPKDSVLVGCIGNVGKIGMAPDEWCATNQQINSVICSKEFNPHFLYYCLQFHRPRLEQAAARVTLPILNKSNFENFLVAAPKKAHQDEVAEILSVVDEKTAHHRRKHATLSALFRTLLHQLMTAQLRVHDLDLPELLK